jgi:hypothetical protein
MKFSFDTTRLLHLLLLLALTIAGGQLLTRQFGWSGLSAYATACTLFCQINSVLMKLWSGEISAVINQQAKDGEVVSFSKERKMGGGNPKKKCN